MWGSRSDVNLHHPQTATVGNTSAPGTAKYIFFKQGYTESYGTTLSKDHRHVNYKVLLWDLKSVTINVIEYGEHQNIRNSCHYTIQYRSFVTRTSHFFHLYFFNRKPYRGRILKSQLTKLRRAFLTLNACKVYIHAYPQCQCRFFSWLAWSMFVYCSL